MKGHAGIEGNEGADAMANKGARRPEMKERDWKLARLRVEGIVKQLESGGTVDGIGAGLIEEEVEEEVEVVDKVGRSFWSLSKYIAVTYTYHLVSYLT